MEKEAFDQRDMTILIVDDEPRIRDFVRMNLELERYRVIEASNGIEALEQLRENLPDLIVLAPPLRPLDPAKLIHHQLGKLFTAITIQCSGARRHEALAGEVRTVIAITGMQRRVQVRERVAVRAERCVRVLDGAPECPPVATPVEHRSLPCHRRCESP